MKVLGDRQFVELPGDATHELPPLFVRERPHVPRLDRVVRMARELIDAEDLIPTLPLDAVASTEAVDRRKMDLAINLVEQYLELVDHWQWGDSILEWIRQCETTFGTRADLRPLIRPDVWPHAGRSSFVTLLDDKHVPHPRVKLEEAVGLRLTFRQPPPLACCSDQFLFYLNSSVSSSAYQAWARMSPAPVASLPPERFSFELVKM
ncbi:MAG: hypothetical protein KIT09_22345 [Bryobacteraceae bacterium]|nr:hypothetical protein [Bryobacteraceae bacterium]